MAQLTAGSAGKVVALQGKAVARTPGGGVRLLQVGDWVSQDDVIVTAQNGFVQLTSGASPSAPAPASQVVAPPADAPSQLLRGQTLSDSAGGSLQTAFRADTLAEASPFPRLPALGREALSPLALEQRSTSGRTSSDRLAPTALDQQLSTQEDTPLAIRLSGHDADGSLSRYLVVKVPTGGVMSKPGGTPIADGAVLLPAEAQQLVFSPAPDFHGNPGALQYRVLDNAGHVSAVASVAIVVAAVNDAPLPGTVPLGPDDVAIADPNPNHLPGTPDYRYSTSPGAPVAGRVQATDVDLDPVRFSTGTAPLHGNVVLQADGSFVYQASAGYQGSDQFVVRVDDGRGGVATSTVFIEVGTASPQHSDKLPSALVAADTAANHAEPSAFSLTQGVFAWSLAEPTPVSGLAGRPPHTGTLPDTLALPAIHAPLDLRDLLPGLAEELMLPGSPPAGSTTGPQATHLPSAQMLDLHLDLAMGWAWQRPAIDPLREHPGQPTD